MKGLMIAVWTDKDHPWKIVHTLYAVPVLYTIPDIFLYL